MTAPTAVADVTARITQIASTLAALSAQATTTAARGTSSSTGSSAFAAELARQTSATTASTGGGGDAVVTDAKKYLGIPYVWGGESRSGMDCSGLVQRTFADLGVKLPRTAAEQQQMGTPVGSLAEAKPGDLLFFGSPAYHVAIYAGDNKLIESPEPGKTVHITDVYQRPTSIRRIDLPTVTPATGDSTSSPDLAATGISTAVARFGRTFAAAEQTHGLPSGLLAAVAQQESGGNPHAMSRAGAEGLMQLMPSTAAGIGVNPFDPEQAIEGAAQILQRNLHRYGGSVELALAAYNAGAGAVDRYGGIPPFTETQNYVRSITAMLQAGG